MQRLEATPFPLSRGAIIYLERWTFLDHRVALPEILEREKHLISCFNYHQELCPFVSMREMVLPIPHEEFLFPWRVDSLTLLQVYNIVHICL